MSSKLSFSRRQVLKFRSIDSGSDPTSPDSFNLPSPEPIGESNDLAMGVLGLTLVALKELSSLAEQIPYICPVASIILDALKMKDEVKQYKEEWEAVMEKLHNVGTVVVYVGKMCQRHGLKKEELPSDLLTVLGTLQSDLDGIDTALKKCAEIKGVKEVPLRADMLRKVKQYDRSLFNILQVFQARQFLSLLAQIIRQRNVWGLVLSTLSSEPG
ncbi:hypothetical protein BGW80DRAFT_1308347 [Lactifluus volemus]|nr:hypothetical protein BGW80DRAFT_1308347 [Lactifluus volemus]